MGGVQVEVKLKVELEHVDGVLADEEAVELHEEGGQVGEADGLGRLEAARQAEHERAKVAQEAAWVRVRVRAGVRVRVRAGVRVDQAEHERGRAAQAAGWMRAAGGSGREDAGQRWG